MAGSTCSSPSRRRSPTSSPTRCARSPRRPRNVSCSRTCRPLATRLPGRKARCGSRSFAPAGTPVLAIVTRLNREINAALGSPHVKESMARGRVGNRAWVAEALAGRIRADIDKWRNVINRSGIKAESHTSFRGWVPVFRKKMLPRIKRAHRSSDRQLQRAGEAGGIVIQRRRPAEIRKALLDQQRSDSLSAPGRAAGPPLSAQVSRSDRPSLRSFTSHWTETMPVRWTRRRTWPHWWRARAAPSRSAGPKRVSGEPRRHREPVAVLDGEGLEDIADHVAEIGALPFLVAQHIVRGRAPSRASNFRWLCASGV